MIARSSAAAAGLLFVLSAAVLVIEILAARLLAPIVGQSLETYTAIIGVVLGGIAVGHAIGGSLADRAYWRLALGWCVLIGGVSAGLTVPIVSIFGTGAATDLVAATVLVTFAAFFLPTAALSAASPIITRARMRELSTAGHVIGRLSAVSTFGALTGTFVSGFVIVGWLPTSRALYGLAAVVTVIGVGLISAASGPRRVLTTAAAVSVLGPIALAAPSPCPRETEYYCVSVRRARDDPGARVLKLDRLIQGYSDIDEPARLGFRFQRAIAAAIGDLHGDGPVRALHVGGGAFALPRYLASTRPGSTNRVLEIDPDLDDVAADLLGLDRSVIDVRNGDGRILLERESRRTYDLVVNDALGSLSPPWQLTTVEVAEAVERILVPGGTYVVNAVDKPPMRFARAEAATLRTVFDTVTIVVPPPRGRESPANVVLVATNSDRGSIAIPPQDGLVLDPRATREFVSGAVVLRDDFAPVERLVGAGR